MVISDKFLLSQNDEEQSAWLQKITLKEVIQLADYRLLLFHGAKCPGAIVHFSVQPFAYGDDTFRYCVPKFNRDTCRSGAITSTYEDEKSLTQRELLWAAQHGQAARAWKQPMWATFRDRKLLGLLDTLYPPLGAITGQWKGKHWPQKRWGCGQGCQPLALNAAVAKELKIEWATDQKYLSATDTAQDPWHSDFVVIPQDLENWQEAFARKGYRTDYIHCQRQSELYHGPRVLVSQGYAPPKVTFCDADAVFQDDLQAIFPVTPSSDDCELLLFLCAYLRSPLAKYFLFHTAANWGTERSKVHLYELLRLPFPLPEKTAHPEESRKILLEISVIFADLRAKVERLSPADAFGLTNPGDRQRLVEAAQQQCNPLIYRYFGLTRQEIDAVEDTVSVIIPSATPSAWDVRIPTLQPVDQEGLESYAGYFCEVINSWKDDFKVPWELHALRPVATAEFCLVAFGTESGVKAKLPDIPALFARNREFLGNREIISIGTDTIQILRPNQLGRWTRLAAMNDAARFFIELGNRWGRHDD